MNSTAREDDLIRQGKALALAIKGLMALTDVTDGFGVIERRVRVQLIHLYRRELKAVLAKVPAPAANEILAIVGPERGVITRDPSQN